jgi:orotate phosphoribosyltransferase
MDQIRAMNVFRAQNALLEGHFELASGLHSDTYLQCALITQCPDVSSEMCRKLADKWRGEKVDVVVGPATGGIIIAYEIARQLDARALFMERVEGRMTLRRAFHIPAGARVLVAEDVMTTGGSVAEVVEAVEALGAKVVGLACFVDRGGLKRFASYPTASILTISPPTYKPQECPLCKKGLPIDKPGMKGVSGSKSGG